MSLDPWFLDEIDLGEELRQRDYSPNLPREVQVAILRYIWNEVEKTEDRPLRQLFLNPFEEEMQNACRQIGAIEYLFRSKVVDINRVWTRTFQAAWAFYRHEERAIRENLPQYIKWEDRLRDIMAELCTRISWENQNYSELWTWMQNGPKRRAEKLYQLIHQRSQRQIAMRDGEIVNHPAPQTSNKAAENSAEKSPVKRRLGARMSTGGRRCRRIPKPQKKANKNKKKAHAKHGQHAMGSKAETVARREGNVRRSNNSREQATPAVRPGPSSTVTSGALQEMSPSTGAIRKQTVANSGGINRMQRAIGSNDTHAAATNPPQRQLNTAMDVDNDTSSEDENAMSSFAESYVPTDGECESDCTIVYEENFDDEPETLTDLEEQLNGYLQQADAERAAARAQRSLRAPLPQWPPRDPNAPTVTDTPPVCYRRGERFLPYDLQVIVSRDLHQFFAAQANGERPPRPRNITVEERQAVQRQLDLEAEMNERQEMEVGLEQPMREIAMIDIPEPVRPPPVAMPQDQPENRRNFDVPCVCCAERMVNTIFMPCRHACYCWTCAMDNEFYNETCYMCRQEPELRAYMYGQ
jgi:hypothetical protein